jgi:hypothetical protein
MPTTYRQLWKKYFRAIAIIWMSLAGVGFLLALVFMSDSSPDLDEYLTSVATVALVLFVCPLLVIAAITALLAALHQLLRRLFNR